MAELLGEAGRRHRKRGDLPELLFDVAAVVSTSAMLGVVAGAFGVHEITPVDTSIHAIDDRSDGGLFGDLGGTVSGVLATASYTTTTATTSIVVPMMGAVESVVTPVAAAAIAPVAAAVSSSAAGVSTSVGPAISDPVFSGRAGNLPVAPPVPFIGPGTDVGSPSEAVKGTRLLQQLSLVSLSRIPDFVKSNPELIETLITTPPLAADVSTWWKSMDLERRNALREASPRLVGNLDGIPFVARDLANRSLLDATIAELHDRIANEDGRTMVETAKQQLRMLESIAAALGSPQSNRTLMTLDVTSQGRAAIVLGDLRTADYVSYLVPGMFFTIENQMGYWTDAAARLRDEQLSWLALLADGQGATQDKTVATVAWIGYHTPNLTNVGAMENAYEGRDSLAAAIEGLQALRAEDEPYVTVIAHSYGSTAALMALTEYSFEIDALAVVGSPGSPAQSVDELHVRNGNVFVGEAPWDPVPDSSFFGSDPGATSYGAIKSGATGGTDPVTGETLLGSFGHIEYFSPGTESLRNLALIGIGQGRYVTSGGEATQVRALSARH